MNVTSWRAGDIVDALVALAGTVLPDVQVVDGTNTKLDLKTEAIVIGWSDGTSASVSSNRGDTGVGARADEDGAVACWLRASKGKVDLKARRDEAVAMLTAIEAALRADPTLGGVVDDAQLGDAIDGLWYATPDGSTCEITFSVRYEAYV